MTLYPLEIPKDASIACQQHSCPETTPIQVNVGGRWEGEEGVGIQEVSTLQTE